MFDDLDTFDTIKTTEKPAATFPCDRCGGRGTVIIGYANPREVTCAVCHGKGSFKTSSADRKAAQKKRILKRFQDAVAAKKEFDAQNPGLAEFLKDAGSWSDFAKSLSDQVELKGTLSEKQLAAAKSMRAKVEHNRKLRAEASKAAQADIGDIQPIVDIFNKARAEGKKRFALRMDGLKVTLAAAHGKNPGALYVKDDSDGYLGKITPDGTWRPVRGVSPAVAQELARFARDPLGEARAYGQRTGNCCVCGRELTDHNSIEAGIGPVCAEAFG